MPARGGKSPDRGLIRSVGVSTVPPAANLAGGTCLRAIPILLAIALAAGCAPRDRAVRLARVAGERKNLEASLEQLEERLLADQSRVRFWREMKDRHESVSAVA